MSLEKRQESRMEIFDLDRGCRWHSTFLTGKLAATPYARSTRAEATPFRDRASPASEVVRHHNNSCCYLSNLFL